MTNEQIFEGIKKCLDGYEDHFDINSLAYCTNMREEFNFDSLDYVEFAMALEEHFGIDIRDEDAINCYTIADLITLISKNIEEQNKLDEVLSNDNEIKYFCKNCKYFQCDKPNIILPCDKGVTTRFEYFTKDINMLAETLFNIKNNTPWHADKDFKNKEIEKIKRWLSEKI